MTNEKKISSELAESGMLSNTSELLQNSSDNYFKWNLDVFELNRNCSFLEVGCGPGAYYNVIKSYCPTSYIGLDYSDLFLNLYEKKIENKDLFKLKKINLIAPEELDLNYFSEKKIDVAICFDVIEHIKDDVSALKNIKEIMRCSSCKELCIRVPAFNFIYGENDISIGHYRRYTKKTLKSVLLQAGFEIEFIRYQNMPGVLPWFWIGRVLKRKIAASCNERSLFDFFVPIIKRIESFISPPFGLSVYAKVILKD